MNVVVLLRARRIAALVVPLLGCGAISCSLLLSTTDLSNGASAGASSGGDDGGGVDGTNAACDADTRADLDNCGACGNRCLTRANGFPKCELGVCGSTCNATFGDCDNNPANGCEASLNADGKNCGVCGKDCGGGACVDGACRAIKLVDGQAQIYSVVSDGAFVFFTSAADGSVYRCETTGCPGGPKKIGVGNERAYFLDIDATSVYWNNNSTFGQTKPGQVMGCAKTGCTQPQIFTSEPMVSAANPTSVTVDDNSVYWSSNEGTIWRASKQAVAVAPAAVTKITNHGLFVSQKGNLYITSDDDDAIYVCPVTGCASPPPRLVAETQPGISGVASDGTSVFWVRSDGVFAYVIGSGASAATKLAPTTASGRLAISGNDLYWTEAASKRVMTMPKTGGTSPRVLASDQVSLQGIAADAKFVYWVSVGEGAIYKLAR